MTLLAEIKSRIGILAGWQSRVEKATTGVTILVYHSVVDRLCRDGLDDYVVTQRCLDRHIRFFKQRGRILALSELVDLAVKRQDLPNACYVLTFDDALQCQLTFAKQVLDSHRVPWTLGIPAGLVERERSLWSYELRFLIRHCWNRSRLPAPDRSTVDFASSTFQERQAASRAVFELLMKRCDLPRRREYVDELIDFVGKRDFFSRFEHDPRFRMANWMELRKASGPLLEFASHGWDHVPHLEGVEESVLRKEFNDSRDTIANQLGNPPETFVFPHGVSGAHSTPFAQQAGYKCCLTTESSRINSTVDLMRIPRFDAEYSLPVLRRHLTRGGSPSPQIQD